MQYRGEFFLGAAFSLKGAVKINTFAQFKHLFYFFLEALTLYGMIVVLDLSPQNLIFS